MGVASLFGQSFNNDKKIFHAFLFNTKNYSTEVNDIKTRSRVEYHLTKGVNNFNIKQIIFYKF